MTAAELAAQLGGQRVGSQFKARCPAHDDQHPSLSITDGDRGQVLVHCFVGCTFEAIRAALASRGVQLGVRASDGVAAAALDYYRRGWTPVPLKSRSKVPKAKGWPERRFASEDQVREDFGSAGNVGLNLGASDLVDIEADTAEALELLAQLPATGAVFGRRGKPAAHRLYRTSSMIAARRYIDPAGRCALEVRSGRQISMAPPSVHPGGEMVSWHAAGDPAEIEAASLQAAVDTIARAGGLRLQGEAAALGVRMSDVQPARVEWLWEGRIPLGKLTILDGDPGLGKSTIALDLAARVSCGREMPDGTPGRDGGVVVASAEDGLADTVRPRLDAAWADTTRILALRLDEWSAIAEIVTLRAAIREVGALLVIVDPLMAYLGSATDSYRDQDVRQVLAPLSALADETGAAILIIRHLRKAAADQAVYRGGGSIGIIGAARSGLLIATDPDDRDQRVLASTKANLSRLAPSLRLRLVEAGGTARVEWGGVSPHTAEVLLVHRVPDGKAAVQDIRRALGRELVETLEALDADRFAPGDLVADLVATEVWGAELSGKRGAKERAAAIGRFLATHQFLSRRRESRGTTYERLEVIRIIAAAVHGGTTENAKGHTLQDCNTATEPANTRVPEVAFPVAENSQHVCNAGMYPEGAIADGKDGVADRNVRLPRETPHKHWTGGSGAVKQEANTPCHGETASNDEERAKPAWPEEVL